MATQIEIVNLALVKLGQKSIASLDENNKPARVMKTLYNNTRDTLLRSHDWNFARKRAQLAASTTIPLFGFNNAFPLPSDFLKLSNVDEPLHFSLEAGSILTDDTAPLELRYIAKIEDASKYDPAFANALASILASEAAEILTQSNTKIQILQDKATLAVNEARRMDSLDNISDELDESAWLESRI